MRRGIAKDSDFKSSLWSQYEEETTGGARRAKMLGDHSGAAVVLHRS